MVKGLDIFRAVRGWPNHKIEQRELIVQIALINHFLP